MNINLYKRKKKFLISAQTDCFEKNQLAIIWLDNLLYFTNAKWKWLIFSSIYCIIIIGVSGFNIIRIKLDKGRDGKL